MRVGRTAGSPARPVEGRRTVAYVVRSPFVSGAERSLIRIAMALDRARYRR